MKAVLGRLKANSVLPDLQGTGPFPGELVLAPGREFGAYRPRDLGKASASM
jgi:hypothetical protein